MDIGAIRRSLFCYVSPRVEDQRGDQGFVLSCRVTNTTRQFIIGPVQPMHSLANRQRISIETISKTACPEIQFLTILPILIT